MIVPYGTDHTGTFRMHPDVGQGRDSDWLGDRLRPLVIPLGTCGGEVDQHRVECRVSQRGRSCSRRYADLP